MSCNCDPSHYYHNLERTPTDRPLPHSGVVTSLVADSLRSDKLDLSWARLEKNLCLYRATKMLAARARPPGAPGLSAELKPGAPGDRGVTTR